jgi:hypothetical protein
MLLIKHQYYDLLKTIGLEGNELEIIPLMKKVGMFDFDHVHKPVSNLFLDSSTDMPILSR